VQAAERRVERGLLAAEAHLDAPDLLGEQAHPRASPGDRLFREDPLLRLGQDVRLVAARRFQMVPIPGHGRVGRGALRRLVRHSEPLEVEEYELRSEHRARLLDPLQERAAGGIGGIGGEFQRGVRAHLACQLLDLLEFGDRLGELGRREAGDPAGVAIPEGFCPRFGLREVHAEHGVVQALVEVGQVPGDRFGARLHDNPFPRGG
jgi:hypothetical protein